MSKAEGGNNGELNSLEAEADMPLEQLLAQYGYVMGAAGDPADANDAPGPPTQTKHKEASEQGATSTGRPAKRRRMSEGTFMSSRGSEKQSRSAAQALSAHASSAQLPSDSESESEPDDDSADLHHFLEDAVAPPGTLDNLELEPPDAVGDMDELDSGHSESEDFDSAAGSDASEDDEQTLEEEERMAHAEGAAQSVGVHAPC